MKKILLALILVAGAVILGPYATTQNMRKKIFHHFVKDIPGEFGIHRIEYVPFKGFYLDEVVWERKNTKVYCPILHMESSPLKFLMKQEGTFTALGAAVYFKDKLLVKHLQTTADLRFTPSHVSLVNPCKVTLDVDEEGTKKFIDHKLVPAFSGKNITLAIDSMSMKNYDFKHLKMEGNLSLNTIRCSKNHLLSLLLSLLHIEPQRQIDLKCEAVHFTADSGIIGFSDTRFLLDNAFEVVGKGTVNLVTEKLNIRLGITSSSLMKAFGLTELHEGNTFPLTIKGSIHKPKFDVKDTMKRIGMLLVLEKLSPEERNYPEAEPF